MSLHLDRLAGARLVVVTFSDPTRLAGYRQHLALDPDVVLVSDVDRGLYRRLHLERGTLRQVWSWGTLTMYGQLLRSGRRLQRSSEDLRQLGADVVVTGDGRIRKVFRPAAPDQRPTVEELADSFA